MSPPYSRDQDPQGCPYAVNMKSFWKYTVARLAVLAVTFVGFGDNPLDLYGKIAMDVAAALLMLIFWWQRSAFNAGRAEAPRSSFRP